MIPTCESEANDRADLMSVCTLPARYAKTAVVKPQRDDRAQSHDRAFEQRADPQQQERAQVDRQGPVEHGARRGRSFHRPRQPAGERHQRRLARRGHQEQQAHHAAPASDATAEYSYGPRARAQQLVEVALAASGGASPRRPAAARRRRRGRRSRPRGRSAPARAAPGRTRPAAPRTARPAPSR